MGYAIDSGKGWGKPEENTGPRFFMTWYVCNLPWTVTVKLHLASTWNDELNYEKDAKIGAGCHST